MKLNLHNVTLIGIDCVNVERLQAAMNVCEKDIQFGAVKLLTSLPTTDSRRVAISHIESLEEYSRFCAVELTNYVDTNYVLVVQYDGFVLNPNSWTDEFLKYDYIGAPWLVADWSIRDFNFPESLLGTVVVGNGGFSLRSKKFLETSAKLVHGGKIPQIHPEDVSLCVWHKDLLVEEGISIAPPELAAKFSIEGDDDTYDTQFGFHGFSWTNIDKWIAEHPEYPLIVESYRQARAAHFARHLEYTDLQVYFISGVCGVGKTSVLDHLKKILPLDVFDVRDFDERGVPDGGGRVWHDNETLHWLDVATDNATKNKSTIVCGFANPERFKEVHQKGKHLPATLVLLHASSDVLRKRLLGRYPTPESVAEINRASGQSLDAFVEGNVSFAPELRTIFEKEGEPIIDTDGKTPEEVAKEIVKDILNQNSLS